MRVLSHPRPAPYRRIAERLVTELDPIIEGDRYPLSPRVTALREIRAMLKPYAERAPPSPQQYFEPSSKGRYRRRRGSLGVPSDIVF